MLSRIRNLEFDMPAVRGAMRNVLFPDAHWTQIRWGPLRGMKIENHADVTLHLLIGAWELRNFSLLQRVFDALNAQMWQGAAIDAGANLGVYSFWLEHALPALNVVYAFEASPQTAERLRAHLAASQTRKIQVVQAACLDTNRPIEFFLSHDHHTSSVIQSSAHADGATYPRTSVEVSGIALDSYLANRSEPIRFIKMDIEGSGVFALPGMKNTIRAHRPLMLIESHSPDEDHVISQMLIANDYAAFRLNTGKWVLHYDMDHTDADGVWGTMLCAPRELTPQLKHVLKP